MARLRASSSRTAVEGLGRNRVDRAERSTTLRADMTDPEQLPSSTSSLRGLRSTTERAGPSKDTPSPSPSSARAVLRHDPYSHRTATTRAAPSSKSIPRTCSASAASASSADSRMRFSQMPLKQSGTRGLSQDQTAGALTYTPQKAGATKTILPSKVML